MTFYEGESNVVLLNEALKSVEFSISLLVAISSATPITIDFFLDLIFDARARTNSNELFLRGILLLSLIIPDCIIYFIIIPNDAVGLLVCIFNLRNATITYAILRHISTVRPEIFSVSKMAIAIIFFMTGHVLICLSAFTADYEMILFYAFIACIIIAFCILLIQVIVWFRDMCKSSVYDITNMSIQDLNINVYLIPAILFGLVYMIECVIYGGSINRNTNSNFLVSFTLSEAGFTIMIFILQGRFLKFQRNRALQVSTIPSMYFELYINIIILHIYNIHDLFISSINA
jgi:hypothetical protein